MVDISCVRLSGCHFLNMPQVLRIVPATAVLSAGDELG
jgi:hypothetical protein